MSAHDLHELLADLDKAPVECDGMCRLITTRLQKQGIPHQVMQGSISLGEESMPLHFWVVVDGLTIDYRARMWLGDKPEVPHGVFRSEDCPICYMGTPVDLPALDDFMFEILMQPFDKLL
jgi:hypothetical protein